MSKVSTLSNLVLQLEVADQVAGDWRLTDETKLECRLLTEEWKYQDLKWSLPDEDTEGCVEDQDSGKVLTILDDKIVLEDKDDPLSDRQKWFRGVKDEDGWFSLKKPLTYTIPDKDTENLTEVINRKYFYW